MKRKLREKPLLTQKQIFNEFASEHPENIISKISVLIKEVKEASPPLTKLWPNLLTPQ